MPSFLTSRSILCTILAAMLLSGCLEARSTEPARFGIVVHGGAGYLSADDLSDEAESIFISEMERALDAGYEILDEGGTSLDAVAEAIAILEDSPHFNAGRGAVFTSEGTVELDASIMDGRTRDAGAVAGIKHVKNPILLARHVMEDSPHVMMVGDGAETFGRDFDLDYVENDYFYTEGARRELERIRQEQVRQGTVGAVALDRDGNLAAGTSTGGMSNKKFGRVGDSPIIGAGTYADNATCAVSATGHGEYFIRSVVAYDVSALMGYRRYSLQEAADRVIMNKLTDFGGVGGIISIDRSGNVATPFNTPSMLRGYVLSDGSRKVAIFPD